MQLKAKYRQAIVLSLIIAAALYITTGLCTYLAMKIKPFICKPNIAHQL
jgi:hypothetical protein